MVNLHRCLIVDDEMPARQELLYILSGIDGVEVVGQASNGIMYYIYISSRTWIMNGKIKLHIPSHIYFLTFHLHS